MTGDSNPQIAVRAPIKNAFDPHAVMICTLRLLQYGLQHRAISQLVGREGWEAAHEPSVRIMSLMFSKPQHPRRIMYARLEGSEAPAVQVASTAEGEVVAF